jgi:hypothetical protein
MLKTIAVWWDVTPCIFVTGTDVLPKPSYGYQVARCHIPKAAVCAGGSVGSVPMSVHLMRCYVMTLIILLEEHKLLDSSRRILPAPFRPVSPLRGPSTVFGILFPNTLKCAFSREAVFHIHWDVKCSCTLANLNLYSKFQTTAVFCNRIWRWSRQSVPKRQHIKFRGWGITQKKEYNIKLMCFEMGCRKIKYFKFRKRLSNLIWS